MPYTKPELQAMVEDTQHARIGVIDDREHWIGLVADLARELIRQEDLRERPRGY